MYLVMSREKLVSISERHLAWMNTPEAIEEKNRKLSESQSARSVAEIKHVLCTSFWLVVGSMVIGGLAGRIYVWSGLPRPILVSEISQYIGVAILLWATLGKLGWSIQTMNGTTLPERINDFVYRLLYVIGSIFLALSASLAFGTAT
ncbi:MAG: hypothetical protein L6364_00840 [Desulfobulbaceae bacterium]|nr:hypothetical protein [Desulfobulbaceae bacterium]